MWQVVVVLVLFTAASSAQPSCGSPSSLSASLPFCAAYVPSQVYVDPAVSTADVTSAYQIVRTIGHLSTAHTGPTRACIDLAVNYVCSLLLRPCTLLPNGSPAYAQPCAPTCTTFSFVNSTCFASFSTIVSSASINASAALTGLLLRSCSSTNPPSSPISGQPIYGPASWPVPNQQPTTVECFQNNLVEQNSSSFPCWDPYQVTSPTGPDGPIGYCEFKCPLRIVPSLFSQYIFQTVISWFIWPMALVAIVLRLGIPKFAQYPANLVQFLLLGWFLAALALAMQVIKGMTGSLCNARPTAGNQWDPSMCGFVAFVWQWGVQIYEVSWCLIAIHAAVTVVAKKDVWNRVSMAVSYALIFFVPLVLSIVPPAMGRVAPLNSNPYCFVSTDLQYYVYWGPKGIMLLIGTVCIVLVLVQFARVSDMTSVWSIKNNLRLLAFLLIQMAWCCTAIGFRFNVQPKIPDNMRNFGAYLTCSMFSECDIYSLPGYSLPLAAVWCVTVALHFCGFLICLLFLVQPVLYTTPLSERQFPWKGGVFVSATSTTAGSSSSSGTSGSEDGTFMSDLQ